MRLPLILAGATAVLAKPAETAFETLAAKPPAAAFETLVTFGDSYTDNGRLGYYINNGGQAPPPGQMHSESTTTASGGLSWAQFAARGANAKLMDYAVSGAVCSNQIVARDFSYIGRTFPAILDDELPSFQADVPFKTLYPNRNAGNTVYAVWIGTNDLGFDAFLSDSEAPGKTISDLVDCVLSVFDAVYKTGGRRFVLLNTGPLEKTPLYAPPALGGTLDSQFWTTKSQYNMTEYSQKIRQYSTSVNTMYTHAVEIGMRLKDRWPKATFDLFDVHSLLSDIHAAPASFLDAPANATGYYHHCPPAGSPCVDQPDSASGYLWYDELHPSNKTSKLALSCPVCAEHERDVLTLSSRLHHWQHLPGRCQRQLQVRHSFHQLTIWVPEACRACCESSGFSVGVMYTLQVDFKRRDFCTSRGAIAIAKTGSIYILYHNNYSKTNKQRPPQPSFAGRNCR